MAIKITRELRREINDAVRKNTGGALPLAELGVRYDVTRSGGEPTTNALAWGDWDDNDLWGHEELRRVREIPEVEGLPGRAFLDVYVTTGSGHNRELETNVYVAIFDGHVIEATSNDRRSAEIEELARSYVHHETSCPRDADVLSTEKCTCGEEGE